MLWSIFDIFLVWLFVHLHSCQSHCSTVASRIFTVIICPKGFCQEPKCVFVCLRSTTSVDYLEGDLGQAEFTPTGCLSLLTVTKPLLGMFLSSLHRPKHKSYQSYCMIQLWYNYFLKYFILLYFFIHVCILTLKHPLRFYFLAILRFKDVLKAQCLRFNGL